MFLSNIRSIVHRIFLDLFYLQMPPRPNPSSAEIPKWKSAHKGPVEPNVANSLQQDGFSLRVLSLNVWGLPVATKCSTRIKAICAELKNSNFDVVCLQEVWYCRERSALISSGQEAGFIYYHYFKSAVGFPLPLGHDAFCTGILVLSKYPIQEAFYYRYTVSGRVYALHESDFLAAKGTGLLRIDTPAGMVDLYTTHLLANYNRLGAPGNGDRYLAHRVVQSYEMTRLIDATAKSNLVLLCGDMNSPPDCLCLRIPMQVYGMRDAYSDSNFDEGLTYGTSDNCFSKGDHPMRMDYILYKSNLSEKSNTDWHLGKCSVYKKFFTDTTDSTSYPVSDHFGVIAEFFIGQPREVQSLRKASTCNSENSENNVSRSLLQSNRNANTCSQFSALSIDVGIKDDSPKKCLDELYKHVERAHIEAIARRQVHLWKAIVSLVLLLFLSIASVMLHWTTMGHAISPILLVCFVTQFILGQVALTWECGSFDEVRSQLLLHLRQYPTLSEEAAYV